MRKKEADERKKEILMEQMQADMDRIRGALGKGDSIEEISAALGLEPEYARFLFYFGIIG